MRKTNLFKCINMILIIGVLLAYQYGAVSRQMQREIYAAQVEQKELAQQTLTEAQTALEKANQRLELMKSGNLEQIKIAEGIAEDTQQQETVNEVQVEDIQVYNDGTYCGHGRGFGGDIEVELTIEQDTILQIEVLSAKNETADYYKRALGVIDKVLSFNSTEVDGISGATLSSNGILDAIDDCLYQAQR